MDPGSIQELWAVPHFGRIAAILLEAIIMLITMIVAAQWVIRRFDVPQTLGATLPMVLIAIALLFPAEIAGVLRVRRLSLHEYLAGFVTVPGVISLLMFWAFAETPAITAKAGMALRDAGVGQICMGEVRGRAPDGFDFGNSPFEISRVDFRGQTEPPA
jgi:hypothetical protein